MSITELAGNAVKNVRLALNRPPTPDDISDEQFMNDLGKIKQLRLVLIDRQFNYNRRKQHRFRLEN